MSTEQPNRNLFLLAKKWLAGQITDQEKSEFDQWYNSFDDTQHQLLSNETEAGMESRIQQAILSQVGVAHKKSIKFWPRLAVTAAAVAAIVFGVWLYHYEVASSRKAPRNDVAYKNDIAPGKNTATLTLPNGSTIQLSDAKTGLVINTMNDATQLTYNDGSVLDSSLRGGTTKQSHTNDVMLTAATPRGGTYQFTLPDGTKVWLNAESKISFPEQFSGATRKILLINGEAYFEVAKNKDKPFIVASDGQEVTVLGTHFNINAYTDEGNTKTTLLEGSVRINNVTLAPNQQATNTNSSIKVTEIDPTTAIAWKNGLFSFKDADIQTVMRQMARWYDVEIEYDGPIPKTVLTGKMYRNVNASQVLKLLDFYQVKHRIVNNKIIISN